MFKYELCLCVPLIQNYFKSKLINKITLNLGEKKIVHLIAKNPTLAIQLDINQLTTNNMMQIPHAKSFRCTNLSKHAIYEFFTYESRYGKDTDTIKQKINLYIFTLDFSPILGIII